MTVDGLRRMVAELRGSLRDAEDLLRQAEAFDQQQRRKKMTVSFPDELLRQIAADGERCYPEEACGLVFGKDGRATEVAVMPNVYARYAKLDPERFPRSNRNAYKMDELKVMNLVDAAAKRGETLVAIYHSHPDVGSYFSAEDKAVAMGDGGTPIWPGAEYFVLAVNQKKAEVAKSFHWDGKDFVGREIALPR